MKYGLEKPGTRRHFVPARQLLREATDDGKRRTVFLEKEGGLWYPFFTERDESQYVRIRFPRIKKKEED